MKGCVETMEVQEALEQLAQAVKESEVYREYRRQSERVDNSGDMREKLTNTGFVTLNYKILSKQKIYLTSWMILRENMRNSGKTRWSKSSLMPNSLFAA